MIDLKTPSEFESFKIALPRAWRTMNRPAIGAIMLLAFSAGLLHDYEPPPPRPEAEFGYGDAEARARVAELRALDDPYTPDTPQPGEAGFGQPKVIIVQGSGNAGAGVTLSGPIAVTPVYYCHLWSFANPSGETFASDYPCESPREHYRTFPNGSGWN